MPGKSSSPAVAIEALESRQMLSGDAPTALVAAPGPDGSVFLSWCDNSAANRAYVVEQRTRPGDRWDRTAVLDGDATMHMAEGLTPGARYYFRVRALEKTGANASNIAAATPHGLRNRSTQVVFDGPITITRGGTYSGNWESNDARIPAVRIRTNEPVIIENSIIRSRSSCIDAYGYKVNLTVRNTSGYGLNPNRKGYYVGRFLDIDGFVNLEVYNNYMENTSGIYVYAYYGNRTSKQTVKVMYNVCKNVDGRYSLGVNKWMKGAPDPDYYRQFFQINGVKNLVGAEVAWNQIINEPGNSRVEENINIHATTGTAGSPFLIHDNYIQGAYPANAVDARTYTGGGIMLSDNGSSYLRAYNNQIVNTGHVGITTTSGHDNWYYNNRVVCNALNPDGSKMPSSNVGAVIWNFNSESTFKNNRGTNNLIGWINSDGQRNDWWVPDAAAWSGNRNWPGNITKATILNEWQVWQNKLASRGIQLGPQP